MGVWRVVLLSLCHVFFHKAAINKAYQSLLQLVQFSEEKINTNG